MSVEKKFRTSNEVEFCVHHRQLPSNSPRSTFFRPRRQPSAPCQVRLGVDITTIDVSGGQICFDVLKPNDGTRIFNLTFCCHTDHNGGPIFRLTVRPKGDQAFRIPDGDVILETVLVGECSWSKGISQSAGTTTFSLLSNQTTKRNFSVVVQHSPFEMQLYSDERCFASFNTNQLLKFSEEDSSPGADVTFPSCSNLYGLAEHADSFRLKSTLRGEPYRLYNVDNFGYRLDSRAALYGSVPLVVAPGTNNNSCSAVLWLNCSETWVDVDYRKGKKQSIVHFMSEAGAVDIFFLTGPRAVDVLKQQTLLTGPVPLPPLFALGYHQSRWNYNDQGDVLSVSQALSENGIPCDTIWLDIEHTDSKKYFTWDETLFPNPRKMIDTLASTGRRVICIVDPHLAVDENYNRYSEAKSLAYFVKHPEDADFVGQCWPGKACWPDFTRREVRDWWGSQYAFAKYPETNDRVYIWNDMNEPAVFLSPEGTMPKDARHGDGTVKHCEVHNIYGHYMAMATFEGLLKRGGHEKRPFVLTRSFFAGSQRYAAVWTGDNVADWSHLRYTTPMLLSLGLCGIAFCGADVGGFHLDPDEELLTRWFQAGAFHPFFREHSYSRRREPYLFSGETNERLRSAVQLRYTFLPLWYTLFHELETTGIPPMRPLWLQFEKQPRNFKDDWSFMIGDALFVHPVTRRGARYEFLRLPNHPGSWWYRLTDHKKRKGGKLFIESVTLDSIPVYQRGGSIIARWMEHRQASDAMHSDAVTLYVCLDQQQRAEGRLFVDDFDGYAYRDGKYCHSVFTYEQRVLSCQPATDSSLETQICIDRVIIFGMPRLTALHSVSLGKDGKELEFHFDRNARKLEIATAQEKLHVNTAFKLELK